MIQQIRNEIEDLENLYNYDKESIKSNVETVLNKYNAKYKVVCDNSNNSPYQNNINVDVYIEPKFSTQKVVLNMIIEPDRRVAALKKLKKERIEKINKLNELYYR